MSVTLFRKSIKKRRKKHGFRKRMKTLDGRKILSRRRSMKRRRLAPSTYKD